MRRPSDTPGSRARSARAALVGGVALLGGLLLALEGPGPGAGGAPAASHRHARADSTTTTTTSTSSTTTVVTTTTGPPSSTSSTTTSTTFPAAAAPGDPFADPAIARYLAGRAGVVTAGLYDPASGRTYLWHPGVREVTASMVKIDILADLLYEHQADGRPLSASEQALAASMVEDSDNTAGQQLWNDIGGFGTSRATRGTGGYYAISAFDRRLGLTQTVTNWAWGLLATTPRDYLRLLEAIWLPGGALDPASQAYERRLMEGVVPAQRFGIPNGVPKGATVGVKDGWYLEKGTGWQVNSAGYVRLGRVRYLAVVMTAHDPSEAYGLDTVNTLGTLLWRFESRARP